MKRILILGSTGSIGVSTLDIVREFKDQFSIAGLTIDKNIDLLIEQIDEFKPDAVAVRDRKKADELRKIVGSKCNVFEGEEGIIELSASLDYDILLSSMVGFAGLAPTIEGIKRKKRIALANKETLVAAGELVTSLCEKYGAEMLPVDSEHSAIFQCLIGEEKKNVDKLILTASGGPFLNKGKEELKGVTIADALNHPNWKMGSKITIDSATMMNKGLEVIEAHWLFNLPKERIDVVVHPQSVIHSMVAFIDGSIKAQISTPDMKLPILYALSYPERLEYKKIVTNFSDIGTLSFQKPDAEKFECLKLAYDVMEAGGTAPCILNAANEIAVHYFLEGKISFNKIPELISYALDTIENHKSPNLETIFECNRITRECLNKKFN
ncbi:MAG: 1-deoxy-D-xylulose-5-phosphate reductoisomerase [Melioribacteraceae bacterium]|nr:1-deoxy-D-xylulose-5-phosphate reductoisomerase [Melioribacteraceae bacterium]